MCYNTFSSGKTSAVYPQKGHGLSLLWYHNRISHFRAKEIVSLKGEKGGVTLKQFWSKSLACLLCLALLAGMLPVGALAEEPSEPVSAVLESPEVSTTDGSSENNAIPLADGTGDFTVAGGAQENYSYADGVLTIHSGTLTVSGSSTTDRIVVDGNANLTLDGVSITFNDGMAGSGDTTESNAGTCALSLGANTTLNLTIAGENTLQSGAGQAGIFVPQGSTLTINGEGTLNVTGGRLAAGIGGDLWHNAGTISIENGIINATGGSDAAAIGGGHANDGLNQQYGGFTSISITGGTVNAETTGNAAAIGTGVWSKQAGTISITNSIVSATTNGTAGNCAAVGRGYTSNDAQAITVSITDSIVTATNARGNSISTGGSNDVTISNSIVSVSAGSNSAGSPTLNGTLVISDTQTLIILADNKLTLAEGAVLTNKGIIINYGTIDGSGSISNNGMISNEGTITLNSGTVLNNKGIITNSGTITGDGSIQNDGTMYNTGEGEIDIIPTGTSIEDITEIKYLDESREEQRVMDYTLLTSDKISWTNGWYVALGPVSIPSRVTVNGTVHLILVDGCNLTVNGGISVGGSNTLTIYGQSSGTGKLTATGGWMQAGIGGESVGTGTITINGGTVTANGGDYGAGIGGGYNNADGTITINGGMVTATGGINGAAGIGCGAQGVGATITITGGTVIANGDNYADGIGSGRSDHGTAFSTGNDGHAVIITNGISNESNKGSWNGVIFDRNSYNGQVYGSNVTPTEDFEIPEGYILTIPEGTTLDVSHVTVTNNGVVNCYGTINGKVGGDVRYPSGVTVAFSGEGVNNNTASYGSTITITATMQRAQTNGINAIADLGKADFYLGDVNGGTSLGSADVTGAGGTYTATLEVTLTSDQWKPGSYTITADFGGVAGTTGNGLVSGTGTTTLTVTKGSQTAPAAPTMSSRTTTSVTLNAISGGQGTVQYGYVQGDSGTPSSWQDDTFFNDLQPGTDYTFYARYAGNDYYNPAVSITGTTITTLGAEGGDTLADGETITIEDGTNTKITNEGGKITITPGDGGTTTIITPDDGTTVNGDGTVNAPGGFTVTTGDGPIIIVGEDGATVGTNGEVTLPNGGSATIGSGDDTTTITTPEGGKIKPNDDGTATIPDGFTVQTGDGPEMTLPDGGTVDPDTGAVTPDDGGSVVIGTGDGTTTITPPNGGTITLDGEGNVTIPGGSTVADKNGDEYTYPPEGGSLDSDGTVVYTVTVTFDSQGGSEVASKDINVNNPVEEPATPTRSGYSFRGWYTAASGGERWDFAKPVAADMTLYAQWSWINVGGPTYPPTMDEPENGAVTTSPSRPEEGDTVTITPKPDEGFEVDEIHITDEDGKEIAVTQNPDGTYTFTQPDGKVTITVTFRCDGGELCPGHHLTDVSKDAWYHAAVDYVVKQGIMEGMSATTFSPNTEVTRAQAVQILYNLEGQPDVSDENLGYPYEDVNAEEWYGNAVYWARLTGVATGYGDGTFQPGDNITRQEFAQMLYNYAKYKGYDLSAEGDLSQFPDSGSVANWAEAAMRWANGNELINGHDDGTIDAGGTAIRAQAASILMKFDQNLTEE